MNTDVKEEDVKEEKQRLLEQETEETADTEEEDTPEDTEEELAEETEELPEESKLPFDFRNWFIIHTYAGYENKVKSTLEKKITLAGFGEVIKEIMIPTEKVIDMKNGERRELERKFFPGYILVKIDIEKDRDNRQSMEVNEARMSVEEGEISNKLWQFIKSIPGVSGFVGPGGRAKQLQEHEVETIMRQIGKLDSKAKPRELFKKGEMVKVTDGPFTDFIGRIEEIHVDKEKLKVMVEIFGRYTPVELEFLQVERL